MSGITSPLDPVERRSSRLVEENAALRETVRMMGIRIAELEALADSDTLTPLPNRRMFERELERTIARVARYGTSAALLYIDLDGLKGINDFHGHGAGDLALIHVAELLKEHIRAGDLAARLGGDEFGVLLHSVSEEAAREKAQSLAEVIAATPMANGMRVSVSVGVTTLVVNDAGGTALGRADGDMYRLKRNVL
ncbi:GGDEF domain-containing protein [Sphingomonas jejuensis]|nr:GGDEF domain-containing protein [Sphingomonas jejuensis]